MTKTPTADPTTTGFIAWMSRLRTEIKRRRYDPAYGADADAWRPFFDDGYTPADAIDADEAHG